MTECAPGIAFAPDTRTAMSPLFDILPVLELNVPKVCKNRSPTFFLSFFFFLPSEFFPLTN